MSYVLLDIHRNCEVNLILHSIVHRVNIFTKFPNVSRSEKLKSRHTLFVEVVSKETIHKELQRKSVHSIAQNWFTHKL